MDSWLFLAMVASNAFSQSFHASIRADDFFGYNLTDTVYKDILTAHSQWSLTCIELGLGMLDTNHEY